MSETHHENTNSSNVEKSSLTVWFSSILVNLSFLISNTTLRQIAVTFSPPLGYGLAKLCRIGFQEFQHRRACKIIENDIKSLEAEAKEADTTKGRKIALRKKIDELRSLLQQRKLSNLDIKTGKQNE